MHALATALVLLHGIVTAGPTQPVCREGVPCSRPAAHVELVFRRGAVVAARVRTDGHGRYAVRLRPGSYTAAVVPRPAVGAGLRPALFTLGGGRRLDFQLDTGIR